MSSYTDSDYQEFRRLVEMGESQHQMDRIHSRLDLPKLIDRLGRDTCDEMFKRLCSEDPGA